MTKKIYRKVLQILMCIGTIFLFFILPLIARDLLKPYIASNNFWLSNFGALGTSLIVLIVFVILFRKILLNDLKSFKSKYIEMGLPYWLVGCFIMIISNTIIHLIVGDIASNESLNREIINKLPIYALLNVCLIGPITEEIAFRLSTRSIFKNKILYALLSGLIFGYLHTLTGSGLDFLYIIPYGALGFVFALAVDKTDNIFTSIALHIIHNSVTILILFVSGGIL